MVTIMMLPIQESNLLQTATSRKLHIDTKNCPRDRTPISFHLTYRSAAGKLRLPRLIHLRPLHQSSQLGTRTTKSSTRHIIIRDPVYSKDPNYENPLSFGKALLNISSGIANLKVTHGEKEISLSHPLGNSVFDIGVNPSNKCRNSARVTSWRIPYLEKESPRTISLYRSQEGKLIRGGASRTIFRRKLQRWIQE